MRREPGTGGRSRPALRRGAVLAPLAVALACGGSPPEPSAPAAACPELSVRIPAPGEGSPGHGRSLIVVLADTLRRDRLGAYGGPAHTPAFDAFARDNLLFAAATSHAPWTKPSIATLFTGLYPSQHGVVSHPKLRGQKSSRTPLESDVLAPDLVTLAEELSASGYATAAFVSNPWLQPGLGFAQGFDVYDHSFAANNAPGRVVTSAGLDWLASRKNDPRPFFLYLHYMDVHSPYAAVPDEALAARREEIDTDRRHVTNKARESIANFARGPHGDMLARRGVSANRALMELVYDLGVERFDRALGELLEGLSDETTAQDAAIVVTADHGEALFAHGWGGHGYGLFEDELAIPLAMHLPGVHAAGSVSCVLGLVDLRRTLCDYLDLECHSTREGRSLLGDEPAPDDPVVISEGVISRPRHRAVRDVRYELIYEPDGRPATGAVPALGDYSLYDLTADPDEDHDLLQGDRPPEVEAAFSRLEAVLEHGVEDLGREAPSVQPLESATEEQLRALGYVHDEE